MILKFWGSITIGMNILRPSDCKSEFVIYFRDYTIIPVVGSGMSCGAKSRTGKVPDGRMYKNHMIETVRKTGLVSKEESEGLERLSFSEIAGLYDDDDIVDADIRRDYLYNNFFHVHYSEDDDRHVFFDIGWPYIYSLNVDDAIEQSTEYEVVLPNREFNLDIFDKAKCLLKLHGDIKDIITYQTSYKVFTTKEYISSLFNNRAMLNKLAADYGNVNLLFVGCSLSDELDLLALDALRVLNNGNEDGKMSGGWESGKKKNYFFTVGSPSIFERTKYKQLGITDIVVFDKYDDIYFFLREAWDESLKMPFDAIKDYSNLRLNFLDSKEAKNKDYFYFAINPIDYRTKNIIYPYYFIERDDIKIIKRRINEHKIQIISGSRFSGKTYALLDIYNSTNIYEKYLFDVRQKFTDEALEELIRRERCLILFDAEAINRKQFEKILSQHKKIMDRNTSIIIIIHSNDSEMIGIIELLKEQHIICADDYYFYSDCLKNKFSRDEAENINKLLPEIGLLPYAYNDTLINHLMNTAGEAKVSSRFSDISIPSKDVKDIALCIALASNEVLFYSEIVALELEETVVKAVMECEPLIEQINTNRFEKSPRDMSTRKYMLNSKYWMRDGLIRYANNGNFETIKDAYRYLIERLIDFSKENLNRRREKYRKIIYFDTINDIFGGRVGGRRDFIAQVYLNLNDLLGTDYQFNHQRAKCLMRNAYYQASDVAKEESYIEARGSALIARRQIENEYSLHHNEKLLISLAHIDYTFASITASLCDLHGYSDVIEVEQTINACYNAAINPYNAEEFKKELKRTPRYGIIFLVKSLTESVTIKLLSTSCKNKYNELLKRVVM